MAKMDSVCLVIISRRFRGGAQNIYQRKSAVSAGEFF
jgi:hypothetical protein